MSNTTLGFKEMKQAMADGRLTITTGKDIVKGTTPNNNVHHAYAMKRQDGVATEGFNFTFPPLLVSHITKQVPKDSKFASYFVHGDIYGRWPLGKNRGEDLKGDELFDFFEELERVYHDCLQSDSETKSVIFLHTDQEPLGRDGRRTQVTDMMSLINPIVHYPVFRDGHPQAKERDDSKSPTFKIKLWDAKITDKNRSQIRADSLLVNVDPMADPHGDPKDPSRYLQMIYTKIYDLRQQRNAMSDMYITKESVLDEFVYVAGDSTKGKSPSTLLATIAVLAPSWYWEAKKGASLQFKATSMEIFRKTVLRRANVRTPEIKVSRYQEAMAAMAEYGLDQLDENRDGDGYYEEYPSEFPPPALEASAPQSTSHHRQFNPNATVAVRPKTNSVVIYPSKDGSKVGSKDLLASLYMGDNTLNVVSSPSEKGSFLANFSPPLSEEEEEEPKSGDEGSGGGLDPEETEEEPTNRPYSRNPVAKRKSTGHHKSSSSTGTNKRQKTTKG